MHIAEVVTIAKSLPLLRLNTYKSLILSYSADYRRIFRENTAAAARMIFLKTACGMTLLSRWGRGLPLSVGMELPVFFIRFIFILLCAGSPADVVFCLHCPACG